jgi:putative sigma-54 modulation protein
MKFQISGRHLALTPAIDEYARRKAARLLRHFDRIQQVDILVDRAKNGFAVEIITKVEHHERFVARMSHADLYASIDLAIDKAVRQLSDHKMKLRNNKHHPSLHHITSGIRAYETA